MPTYEYRCKDCDFEFEEFQSMAAEPLRVCPRCSGHIYRLISGGGGLIFKGSGFYETDYKRKTPSSKSEQKTEKATETASSKSSTSSTED